MLAADRGHAYVERLMRLDVSRPCDNFHPIKMYVVYLTISGHIKKLCHAKCTSAVIQEATTVNELDDAF